MAGRKERTVGRKEGTAGRKDGTAGMVGLKIAGSLGTDKLKIAEVVSQDPVGTPAPPVLLLSFLSSYLIFLSICQSIHPVLVNLLN